MPLHTLMAINCRRIPRHKIYFARSFLWLAVPSASAMDFNGSGGAEGQRGRSSPPASRINAVKYRAVSQEDEIADALIEECSKLDAKLLVMGSYGHSRPHELLPGSATDRVLRRWPFPLLIAH